MIMRAAAAKTGRPPCIEQITARGGGGDGGAKQNNKNKLRVVSTDAAAIFAACDSALFGIREAVCVRGKSACGSRRGENKHIYFPSLLPRQNVCVVGSGWEPHNTTSCAVAFSFSSTSREREKKPRSSFSPSLIRSWSALCGRRRKGRRLSCSSLLRLVTGWHVQARHIVTSSAATRGR